jgi:hypothetical protein
VCGASVEITGIDDLVGKKLAGGDPNPAALARPSSDRAGRAGRTGRAALGMGARSGGRKPARSPAGKSAKYVPEGLEPAAVPDD